MKPGVITPIIALGDAMSIAPNINCEEGVTRFLTLRICEGLSDKGDTYRHLEKHLKQRFCANFGRVPLNQITADHIRAWAAGLASERTGQPLEPLTRRHHLVSVKTFFKRAHGEGWIARDPSRVIVLPVVEEEDVNVIAVKDAFAVFKAGRDSRAIGRLALEAFGGLRYSTAGKLAKDDIKFDRKGIEMPSAKHKSRKRKFRQGQPDNLWLWLCHAPDSCWGLTFRQYRDEKKELHVMAGLRPMVLKTDEDKEDARDLKNVWRHSFATYLLAKVGHFGPVGYLMQHTNSRTTEGYEGVATAADAQLYFSITPESVKLSWEEFVSQHK